MVIWGRKRRKKKKADLHDQIRVALGGHKHTGKIVQIVLFLPSHKVQKKDKDEVSWMC